MSPAAIGLVLLSAGLHVAWNLRSRRERPTPAFFAVSLLASLALLLPVLLFERARIGPVLAVTWPALVGTAVFSTGYNVLLALAYRAADLSLVYPLARSAAPVFVVLASLAFGRGERIGWGIWAGLPAIVAGSLLLPLGRGSDARLGRYLGAGFLAPLAIAACTAGYTVTDDVGMRGTRAATGLPALHAGLLYGALHAVATSLSLLGWVAATRRGRRELVRVVRERLATAVWVGAASYAAYVCVLAAMALADDVSYVAAFRQAGIPLSVVAGALVLGERVGRFRAAGAGLVTAGLVAVALR